jgi:hypothetical protein
MLRGSMTNSAVPLASNPIVNKIVCVSRSFGTHGHLSKTLSDECVT